MEKSLKIVKLQERKTMLKNMLSRYQDDYNQLNHVPDVGTETDILKSYINHYKKLIQAIDDAILILEMEIDFGL